jgi:hypothetical protein
MLCILTRMQQQEHWRRLLLRTEETAELYRKAQEENKSNNKGCRLCNDSETYEDYEFWRLVPNRFPYDRFFSKSNMLITKRHTDENGITADERTELQELKLKLSECYDLIFENLPKQKSIPHHAHYHLVVIRRVDE